MKHVSYLLMSICYLSTISAAPRILNPLNLPSDVQQVNMEELFNKLRTSTPDQMGQTIRKQAMLMQELVRQINQVAVASPNRVDYVNQVLSGVFSKLAPSLHMAIDALQSDEGKVLLQQQLSPLPTPEMIALEAMIQETIHALSNVKIESIDLLIKYYQAMLSNIKEAQKSS